MLVGPDIVLVRNPKAASQSLYRALRPFGNGYGSTAHHICVPDRKWIIGCVREPVERIVSGWRYWCRHKGEESLRDYLRRDTDTLLGVGFSWIPQARWLERCNVVLRFSRLQEDFAAMCDRIGVRAELPHDNMGKKADIDEEDAALIRRRFREDYARFPCF